MELAPPACIRLALFNRPYLSRRLLNGHPALGDLRAERPYLAPGKSANHNILCLLGLFCAATLCGIPPPPLHDVSQIARTLRLQVLRPEDRPELPPRRDLRGRPERVRQIERARRHPLGARRAVGQGAAGRRNGATSFSPAPIRAPALGMAEVSMTFAECEEALGLDWHEVTITRRVFRDGGSEYLLNKTPCRLKDIHQLFMDTGIGRSAYSIMEQGKIDVILSSRPGGSARDFRGSGGHHQIQVPEERGAAEAGGDRGEPAAARGHHQGSEAADRLAPAAGGQGAALPGAGRRSEDARDAPGEAAVGRARRAARCGGATSSPRLSERQAECRGRRSSARKAKWPSQRAALEEMEQQLEAARRRR